MAMLYTCIITRTHMRLRWAAPQETLKQVPASRLGAHMHDTYGMAVANLLVSMQLGKRGRWLGGAVCQSGREG